MRIVLLIVLALAQFGFANVFYKNIPAIEVSTDQYFANDHGGEIKATALAKSDCETKYKAALKDIKTSGVKIFKEIKCQTSYDENEGAFSNGAIYFLNK